MKLYYFDLYAKAEPIRMMLAKAGVAFEDVRVSGQTWADLKPQMEFGQVPCLELDDGTKMYQCIAMYNFVAKTNGFAPEDPMQTYKGEMLYEHIMVDTFFKKIGPNLFKPDGEERVTLMQDVKSTYMPSIFAALDKHLPADKKFICGDAMTTHDFTIGGGMINVFENPNTKDAALWAEIKTSMSPRVAKYVADCAEEMKDYLAARPQTCSL
jgi:glutathione S-transferase